MIGFGFALGDDRLGFQESSLRLQCPRWRAKLRKRWPIMLKFLLWLILLVICWPIALLALVAYPLVWLLLLPFRLIGIAVSGVFELLRAIIALPARVLSAGRERAQQ